MRKIIVLLITCTTLYFQQSCGGDGDGESASDSTAVEEATVEDPCPAETELQANIDGDVLRSGDTNHVQFDGDFDIVRSEYRYGDETFVDIYWSNFDGVNAANEGEYKIGLRISDMGGGKITAGDEFKPFYDSDKRLSATFYTSNGMLGISQLEEDAGSVKITSFSESEICGEADFSVKAGVTEGSFTLKGKFSLTAE